MAFTSFLLIEPQAAFRLEESPSKRTLEASSVAGALLSRVDLPDQPPLSLPLTLHDSVKSTIL